MASRPFVILLKELTLWLYWRFPCIRPMISIFWTIHINTIININTIAAICFLLNLCKPKYLPTLDALHQSIVHGVNKPTTWRWYLRKHCSHASNQFKINIAARIRRCAWILLLHQHTPFMIYRIAGFSIKQCIWSYYVYRYFGIFDSQYF